MRRPAVIAGGVGAAALIVFVLVWFQPQALLIDREVREALPGTGAMADGSGEAGPMEQATEPMDAMSEPAGAMSEPAGAMSEPAGAMSEPVGPVALRMGPFTDRSHPTSGAAVVYELADGTRILRLEGLETDNGPDLYVYLSAAPPDAPEDQFDDDFVDLGRLKGNLGDQNYDIRPGTDLDRYTTVVIWCRRFSVAFGTAALQV